MTNFGPSLPETIKDSTMDTESDNGKAPYVNAGPGIGKVDFSGDSGVTSGYGQPNTPVYSGPVKSIDNHPELIKAKKSIDRFRKDLSWSDDDKSNLKDLEEYFSKSANVKCLLGKNFNEVANVSSKLQINRFAREVEDSLADILGTSKVYGMVIRTNTRDIDKAISLALNYKDKQMAETEIPEKKMSVSERIYHLSQILIKSTR